MVNENDLIKHKYVYFLKTECHLDLYMAYIFFNERTLQPFYENVCI